MPTDARAARPGANWSTEELKAYALAQMTQAAALLRRSAVHLCLAGEAFELIKKKNKEGGLAWTAWCTLNRVPKSSADQAIRIKNELSLEQCEKLPPTRARIAARIAKPKPRRSRQRRGRRARQQAQGEAVETKEAADETAKGGISQQTEKKRNNPGPEGIG
jgi:hypothetical protein